MNRCYRSLRRLAHYALELLEYFTGRKLRHLPRSRSYGDPASMDQADRMDGSEFEYFCAGLLRRNGFSNVRVTSQSGDQGVDILATKNNIHYAIQCKRYKKALNNGPIQEVHAGKAYYGCDVGVVMTNSYFTRSAVDLARSTGTLLWDREVLARMMQQ